MHIDKKYFDLPHTVRDMKPFSCLLLCSRCNERSSAEDGNRDKFSIIECIPLFIAH